MAVVVDVSSNHDNSPSTSNVNVVAASMKTNTANFTTTTNIPLLTSLNLPWRAPRLQTCRQSA
eukprot:2654165-Pyramimonas_sp.AAC.1